MNDKNILKEYFSSKAAIILYFVGCICGVYVAYISFTPTLSTFERIANGIGYPISYGALFVVIYFILSFFLSYLLENYFTEKILVIIITIVACAAGLVFTMMR